MFLSLNAASPLCFFNINRPVCRYDKIEEFRKSMVLRFGHQFLSFKCNVLENKAINETSAKSASLKHSSTK